MLGIDISAGSLRVVELELDGGRFVLRRCGQAAVKEHAEPQDVAAVLEGLLNQNKIDERQGCFSLPPSAGFVRYTSAGENSPQFGLDHVTDSWTCISGEQVAGVAARREVEKISVIAERAGVKLSGITLRTMACMKALGLWDEEYPQPMLGIVVDDSTVTMAFRDGQAIKDIQSRPLANCEKNEVLQAIGQLFRLMKMARADFHPSKILLLWDACTEEDRLSLAGAMEAEVFLRRNNWRPMDGQADLFDLGGRYIAAVGLAMQAIEHAGQHGKADAMPPRNFNFIIRPQKNRKQLKLTWKQWGKLTAVFIAVVAGVLLTEVFVKKISLWNLQQRYSRLEPQINQRQEIRKLITQARPWMNPSLGGSRPAYRNVYDTINNLLPNTDQAYVTWLEIRMDNDLGKQVVRIDGRSTGTDSLYEFVSRLNNSLLFEKAELGTVTDIPDANNPFGKQWTVTFEVANPLLAPTSAPTSAPSVVPATRQARNTIQPSGMK
ncbi:MAG TPA: hypothetical protein PLK08_06075 [Phycisphaerae bacterium]|nr:hypothetical protein [Phycisphaerae bacterium]